MMNLTQIDVECYAGCKADESPRCFHWEGRRIEIAEIIDRWYQGTKDPEWPIANYFKVHGDDGHDYLIKQNRESHQWHMVDRW